MWANKKKKRNIFLSDLEWYLLFFFGILYFISLCSCTRCTGRLLTSSEWRNDPIIDDETTSSNAIICIFVNWCEQIGPRSPCVRVFHFLALNKLQCKMADYSRRMRHANTSCRGLELIAKRCTDDTWYPFMIFCTDIFFFNRFFRHPHVSPVKFWDLFQVVPLYLQLVVFRCEATKS